MGEISKWMQAVSDDCNVYRLGIFNLGEQESERQPGSKTFKNAWPSSIRRMTAYKPTAPSDMNRSR